MKEKLVDWFFDRQLKLAAGLGIFCLAVFFALGSGGLPALVLFLVAIFLIFIGGKLFAVETTDNWLKFSYAEILKKAIGGAFLLFGWAILLRSLLAVAVAAIFQKIS